jgi:hypothetical protein
LWRLGSTKFTGLPDMTKVNYDPITGWGILDPAGTPAVIVAEVNATLAGAFTQREVTECNIRVVQLTRSMSQ